MTAWRVIAIRSPDTAPVWVWVAPWSQDALDGAKARGEVIQATRRTPTHDELVIQVRAVPQPPPPEPKSLRHSVIPPGRARVRAKWQMVGDFS